MPEELKRDEHDLPLRDKVTKEKIDRHLSDKNDTISEQDIKNINTDLNNSAAIISEQEKVNKIDNENNKPEKEAPTTWEVLD